MASTRHGGAIPTPLVAVGNVLAYTDASVANGSTYRYRVSAISAAGEGAPSCRGARRARDRADRTRNLTATTTKSGIALARVAPSLNGGARGGPDTTFTAAPRAVARRCT